MKTTSLQTVQLSRNIGHVLLRDYIVPTDELQHEHKFLNSFGRLYIPEYLIKRLKRNRI